MLGAFWEITNGEGKGLGLEEDKLRLTENDCQIPVDTRNPGEVEMENKERMERCY